MDSSTRIPSQWSQFLRNLKGFRNLTQAQVGLPQALMLHTKAGNPTAPLHLEKDRLLIASLFPNSSLL